MRNIAWKVPLLAAVATAGLFGCDGKASDAQGPDATAKTTSTVLSEERLFGFWQTKLTHEGNVYQVVWQINPGRTLVQWISEVNKDGSVAPAFSRSGGKWLLSGSKLRMKIAADEGKPEIDDFVIAKLSDKQMSLKNSEGSIDLARTASEPVYQAKLPKAASQPRQLVTATEFVPNGESRYLYFKLRAPMQISLSANIDGGPITFMYQPGHFTESDYMSLLQNVMMSGLGAALGAANGSSDARDFQNRANKIERTLKGGLLTKVDAFGSYKGDWKSLPAGEHTIVLDNSGEIGTRRGDAAVELVVYGLQ
ncbi:hypothetical protein [Variovorax sp. RCC_210]|uniref:hypothetical protein n=1 Tax=Variovorax sp. RCC_210 TaxID=3239217 RepID=UPI00352512D7